MPFRSVQRNNSNCCSSHCPLQSQTAPSFHSSILLQSQPEAAEDFFQQPVEQQFELFLCTDRNGMSFWSIFGNERGAKPSGRSDNACVAAEYSANRAEPDRVFRDARSIHNSELVHSVRLYPSYCQTSVRPESSSAENFPPEALPAGQLPVAGFREISPRPLL